MRIMLAMSLAVALLAVGCGKGEEPSARERTLDAQVKRLEAELAAEQGRVGTIESALEEVKDANATLEQWVAERKDAYDEFETTKTREGEVRDAKIKELRAQIEELKAPVALPDGPTVEILQRRITTALDILEPLGAALLDARRYTQARAVLLVARNLGSSRPAVLYTLARASAELKMDTAAEKNFRLALVALEKQTDKDVPLTVRCLLGLGAALRRLDEPKKAIAEWQKAVTLDPKNAAAQYNLGLVYRDMKQPDAAVAALRKHITLGGDRAASAHEMIEDIQKPATTP